MKNLVYFFVLLLAIGINSNAQQDSRKDSRAELNKEKINFQPQTVDQQDNLPQAIIIKKDKNGNMFVYKSQKTPEKINSQNATLLERLPFVSLKNAKGVTTKDLQASINELDNDKPQQSWYYWYGRWGYYSYRPYIYYHYPVYYYSYAYYPYFYYNYNGCAYYYYVGRCGWGYC